VGSLPQGITCGKRARPENEPARVVGWGRLATPGTRIGPYEIVGLLGRGGMGEVYRARDTRLQRDVALKLLPPAFASDHERLARFTREAQLLATLNHPHIAAIYGVEESDGGAALVLELVEGPTLAERIAQGPLPVDETIGIARQIAEALEAAHEQGIIHRDLKPANIKLRPDGTVKVLDFGLAKTTVSPASGAIDNAVSPTLTAHATAAGLILGTAAYMAPEQARGRAVDRRADIWAFGLVLFEMLSGVRPFGGETISETIAAIIKDPPSWTALPERLPTRLHALLRRTLEKDPKRRLRDIGDARLELEDLAAGVDVVATAPPAAVQPRWRRGLPWAIASIATLAAVAFAVKSTTAPVAEPPPLKYTLPITGESLERTGLPAISPDGRFVAFIKGGTLWIRALDQMEPRSLGGTTGAQYPFWSPDSREVAYLTANAIWRVAVDGSPPVRVATYRFSKGGRTPGGVWLADGTIVFAPAATGSGMLAVPAQGGELTDFYTRDPKLEGDFHRPALLPDGRSLVFVVDHVEGGTDTIGVLSNGVRKDVLTVKGEAFDSPVYSPTGHIVYHRETTSPGIWAVPFSFPRLETTGSPFLVAAQGSYPSMSASGILTYAENSVSGLATLAWLDVRSGAVTSALNERFSTMSAPSLSPNGRLAAAVAQSEGRGSFVMVADLLRHTHVRLDDRVDNTSRPGWRDDRTVVYARTDQTIVMRAADGSGGPTEIGPGMQPFAGAGRLVFPRVVAGSRGDLYHLALPPGDAPPGAATLLQQLPQHESWPALSPDGTLLAFIRGDLGQSEVILRTFPNPTGQWQVSSDGGGLAVWSRRGDALYYRDVPGQILRVEVRRTPSLTLGAPQVVTRPSSLVARTGFDVSLDGTRLLMVQETKTDEQRAASLAVVQNWFAAFRK
jgi:Tol biopolymer transport system component